VLSLAVASDGISVRVDDDAPRITGNAVVASGARGLVLARRTDPLGDVGIGVQAVEGVCIGGQRREHGGVVKSLCHRDPATVARLEIQVGQYLGHAPVLSIQHRLHSRGRQLSRARINPVGQRQEDSLGVGVSEQAPDIEQAGHGLVDNVVRHVPACELALLHSREVGLRETRQIPLAEAGRPIICLALEQLGHKGGGLLATCRVLGAGVALSPRRQQVALHVATEGKAGCVPAAVGLRAVG